MMQQLMEDATARMFRDEDLYLQTEPLSICAYNCWKRATCGNTVKMWIDRYREELKSQQISKQIVIMSQANSYSQDIITECWPRAHNVYMRYSRGSINDQSQPNNSVHVGLLHFSNLWQINRNQKEDTAVNDHKTLAAEEWESTLLEKSRELVPGGYLVVRCLSSDHRGHHFGHMGSHNVFDMMADIWRDFSDKDIITKDEKTQNGCVYFRSEEELVAPLRDKDGRLHSSGLRLVQAKTCYTEDIVSELLTQTEVEGFASENRGSNIMAISSYLRDATENCYKNRLHKGRPEDQKDIIMDIFYSRCHALLNAQSAALQFGAYETLLLIKKVS